MVRKNSRLFYPCYTVHTMSSDVPPPHRIIIVSHRLPLHSSRDPSSPLQFKFSFDFDALPRQLSSSSSPLSTPPLFVGTLPLPPCLSSSLLDRLSAHLLSHFHCLLVSLPASHQSDQLHQDYIRFCERYLWPMLHSLSPVAASASTPDLLAFNDSLYECYLSVNKLFARRIMDVVNVENDFVWVHDYHLIASSTFLRKASPFLKIGFFLHSPFPPSEIFRTIPVRDELLSGFLNCDMVGFQTYDYAVNFQSSCLKILGFGFQCKRGYMNVEYHGRNVIVTVLPVGIDINRLRSVLSSPETAAKISELKETYKDRVLMVGVDDVDLFKGVSTKFRAMGKLLRDYPEWRGRLVLVQISNPVWSEWIKGVQLVPDGTHSIRKQINTEFGQPGYEPIVMIENQTVSVYEKAAFYAIADCCVVNAVRERMNRAPYTYTACRELSLELGNNARKSKSVIVVSEFVGCSQSTLIGAIRVNPYDIESVSKGMASAVSMTDKEMQLRHQKHYNFISSYDVAHWVQTFDQGLRKACQEHSSMNYYCLRLCTTFRDAAFGSGFENLSVDRVVTSYKKTCLRLVLLDYDGTLPPHGVANKRPTKRVMKVIKRLCADESNLVFLISGRRMDELAQWFEPFERLCIAAEHGYDTRLSKEFPWLNSFCNKLSLPLGWMRIVKTVMQQCTEATEGSYIESKESALVWHYQNADPEVGLSRANELLENLEILLANEPVAVRKGLKIVEVNPQGISKGAVVKQLIERMYSLGIYPDFVLCLGDNVSDEDMFEAIRNCENNPMLPEIAEVFSCKVGNKKPSRAKYYLNNTGEVLKMLKALVDP